MINIQYFENWLNHFIALKLININKVGNEFKHETTPLTQWACNLQISGKKINSYFNYIHSVCNLQISRKKINSW